ncbi:MAG: menaquinone biosynthetic enzyme MqnA/MqnD family protein [Terriglobia bacterium]
MTGLRISVVQYLNTAPLIWGMIRGEQQGKFQMDFTTPAECADAIRNGGADAGIIPAIEVQRIDGLEVVPGVSISSPGNVKSVILISKKPIEEVQSVATDTSSRTSTALIAILLRKFYGLRPQMTAAGPDPAAMLKSADAALLIGDPALVYQPQGLRVYDLAAEWKKFTGLPFVFALWAGPKSAGLARFTADFQQSRDYGLAHVDEIAAEYAPRHGLTPEQVKIYLTRNIHYTLDRGHREALALFFRFALEEGLIPAVKEIHFV